MMTNISHQNEIASQIKIYAPGLFSNYPKYPMIYATEPFELPGRLESSLEISFKKPERSAIESAKPGFQTLFIRSSTLQM